VHSHDGRHLQDNVQRDMFLVFETCGTPVVPVMEQETGSGGTPPVGGRSSVVRFYMLMLLMSPFARRGMRTTRGG